MTNFIFSKKIKIILVIIFTCYMVKLNALERKNYLWTKLFVFDDYEALKSSNCDQMNEKQLLKFEEFKNITIIEKIKNNFNFYFKKNKGIMFDQKHYDKIIKKISLNKKILNNQYLIFEFENIDDLDFINFKSKHKISTIKKFKYLENAIVINYNSTTPIENIYLYSFKPIKNLKISILTFNHNNIFDNENSESTTIENCFENLETTYYGEIYHLKMQREVIDYLNLNTLLFYGSKEIIILKKNMHTLHDLISFYDFTKINKKKIFVQDFNDDLYLKFELKQNSFFRGNIKYSIDESDNTYNINGLTVNLKKLLEKNNKHNLKKKNFVINIFSNDISRVYLFKKVELHKLSGIQDLRTFFDTDISGIKDKQYSEKENILALNKKLKIKSKIPDF